MKRWMSLGLLLLAASTGCMMLPKAIPFLSKQARAVSEEAEAPRRPVTPEQVTEANAREICSFLQQELERDGTGSEDK
jgi:hypothetical protein